MGSCFQHMHDKKGIIYALEHVVAICGSNPFAAHSRLVADSWVMFQSPACI